MWSLDWGDMALKLQAGCLEEGLRLVPRVGRSKKIDSFESTGSQDPAGQASVYLCVLIPIM